MARGRRGRAPARRRMARGGRTRPVPISMKDFKQKLIDDIKQLQ